MCECVCTCVCVHTTDKAMEVLFNVVQMPFSRTVVPRVTKPFRFMFIMFGNGNLSHAGWKKMREKGREGSPSGKEKKNVLGAFWNHIPMLQISD